MVRKNLLLAVAAVAVFAPVMPASASIVTLTDTMQLDYDWTQSYDGPFNGYSLQLATGNQSTSIRGEVMRPFAPEYGYGVNGVAISGQGGIVSQTMAPFAGPNGGDPGLARSLSDQYMGGTFVFDVHGATTAYKLQLASYNDADRTFDITFGGTTETVTVAAGTSYLYTKSVAVTPGGTVTLSTTGPMGALWLTPTTIPEPATMSLLALGGLGALIRRRK